MSSSLYTKGLLKVLSGDISLLDDNLRFMLIDGDVYTPQLDSDEYLSDIPVLARVESSSLITGRVMGIDAESSPYPQVYFTCAPASVTGPAGATVEALALYKEGLTPETSPIVGFFNGETVSVTLDGGTSGINIGLQGLLRWSR